MGEEIMKFKKIMFVSILLLAILTIGAVSASGENMTSDDLTVTEDMSVDSTTDDVKLGVGDNTELSELISNSSSGSIISLEKDYEYSNSSSEGITIDKRLTIEGNGHSIDAKSSSRIFTISGTVTLKNLILKNGQHEDHGAIVADDELIVPLMILGEQYVGNTQIKAKYIIQNSLTAVQSMVEQHILEHIMTTTHLSIADLIIVEGHCTGMPTKAPHHIGKTII